MTKEEERYYERAAFEIAAKKMAPALAAKAFSETEGDERKTAALYIKYRVIQLAEDERREAADLKKRQAAQAAQDNLHSEREQQEKLRREQTQAERVADEASERAWLIIGVTVLISILILIVYSALRGN